LDLEFRLAEKYKITCVPSFLVGYRRYRGNMSSNDKRMARAFFLVIGRALERNPGLPRMCSKWAQADVYKYVAEVVRRQVEKIKYVDRMLEAEAVRT
jgi:hypothetical protein